MAMRAMQYLLCLFLMSGCAPAEEPGGMLPGTWPQEPAAVIFQIYTRGGFIPPAERMAQTPTLTLLADGRVIYQEIAGAGVVRHRVGQVPAEGLPALYEQLRRGMEPLKARYDAGQWTDDATTRFSLWTADGLKVTEVYAFHLEPQELEQEQAVLAQLRRTREAVLGAMAGEPTPYQPAEAKLIVIYVDPEQATGELKEWPADLPALPAVSRETWFASVMVSGPQAKALLEQVDPAPFVIYRQGEALYQVKAVPVIPMHPE